MGLKAEARPARAAASAVSDVSFAGRSAPAIYRKRQASSLPHRPCSLPALMWHFFHSSPSPGALNMALDEALMHRAAETGAWILRVYGWSAPTLSLGRNQTARGAYDLGLLAARGIDVVRRPTG